MTSLEFYFISPRLTFFFSFIFFLNIQEFIIAENKSNIDKIILENVPDLKVDVGECLLIVW